jgi:hypothetical protein
MKLNEPDSDCTSFSTLYDSYKQAISMTFPPLLEVMVMAKSLKETYLKDKKRKKKKNTLEFLTCIS